MGVRIWRVISRACLVAVICCFSMALGQKACSAEVVTGSAAIMNGNIDAARDMARQDAMRSYAEKQVGVYIDSRTEVSLGMVVSDRIVAESRGYVQIKNVVKEWQDGDIYHVQLDLAADTASIETDVKDLRRRIEMLGDTDPRKGVQVAVSSANGNASAASMNRINHYVQITMQSEMEDMGFNIEVNDDVRAYMASHPDMSDPNTSVEVRKIARNTKGPEDALLRGTLTTVNVRPEKGGYVATVSAAFELVGLEDNHVNSFADYFTAVGKTSEEAENKATQMAAREATEVLGQKALRLLQKIYRGGSKHIGATLVFSGIHDRNSQEQLILQGLEAARCQVRNSSFASDGTYKVVVVTTAQGSLHELRQAILQNIPGITSGNDDENALGARKLYFTF